MGLVHLGLWLPIIEDVTGHHLIFLKTVRFSHRRIEAYYNDGDVDALTPAGRLGRFLIENFVPHGLELSGVSFRNWEFESLYGFDGSR